MDYTLTFLEVISLYTHISICMIFKNYLHADLYEGLLKAPINLAGITALYLPQKNAVEKLS